MLGQAVCIKVEGMHNTLHFLVRKDSLANTHFATTFAPALAQGQVRVAIERFALTSNNISYAALGDTMQYWSFFPAPDTAWGCIPVWGFGRVEESHHSELAVGEKLYGYFPMANRVDLTPGNIAPAHFSDTAHHRAELHPVYNQYMRCAADPFYTVDTEDLQALLRPLFLTAWLVDDYLASNVFFGATAVPGQRAQLLLSSASSKTAYGTAFQLAQREGVDVVGLTSPGNVAFCASLGCYSRVLTYEQLAQIDPDAPCVYVDFAGNAKLRTAIHTHCRQLKFSSAIGATHVSEMGVTHGLPGPKATMFFAPAQIKKRSAEWGSQGLAQRMVLGWRAFIAHVQNPGNAWLVVEHHQGRAAVQAAYAQVLGGTGNARAGSMLSL